MTEFKAEMASKRQELIADIRASEEETRWLMHELHEEVIRRLDLLLQEEGLSWNGPRRRKCNS